MSIPNETLVTADSLSPAARLLVEHAAANPDSTRWTNDLFSKLPSWMASYPYPLQAWPTFVGGPKLDEIRRATTGMSRLVKSVFERIFKNDIRKISAFYRIGNEALTSLLLSPPNGIEEALSRCDFLDTPRGLQCLEVNMGSFIGGWEIRFWEPVYRRTPAMADFLAGHGINPFFRDPILHLFEHLAGQAMRNNLCSAGIFNTLFVMPAVSLQVDLSPLLNEVYSVVLRSHGLSGRVLTGTYQSRFTVSAGKLFSSGGESLHAVLEYTDDRTPQEVFRAFKAGSIHLYSGPLTRLIGDKRNLALLSTYQDSDLFDASERAILEKHLPWSRELVPGKTVYQGEQSDLEDLLLRNPQDFVIKRGIGRRGEGVVIGWATPPGEWARKIRAAMTEGGWLAQEHLSSRPYLFQHADGFATHDVVWGTFAFGALYGGGFLRMIPTGQGAGVINSAQGATEGIIFEV